MDQVDVEMEDAGKVLEDEVMGGEEGAEKEQIDVKQVEEKQQESAGLVNDDVQISNDIRVEQEEQKVAEEPEKQEAEAEPEPEPEEREAEEEPEEPNTEDTKEMHVNESEQELPVDETQENEKDATVTGDDKIDDARNNATENDEDDKIDDHKNDATVIGDDDKIDDSKNDATEIGDDDKIDDSKNDVTEIGDDDKIDDSKNDATKIGDDEKVDGSKIDDSNNGATEIAQDDKTDDNKNEATETGADDKIDDSKKDEATAMDDDDRIHDGKNDATDMDNDRGVLDDTENDGSKNIPEINDQGDNTIKELHQQLVTHNTIVKHSPSEIEDRTLVTMKNEVEDTEMDDGYDSGTPEAQEAFMQEVLALYKTKHLKFTVPKFYGRYLNCLKLWKAVIRLGGYDRVTATKGWRYVGEAFRPPKTCTTVSWTFRQFYEKSLLEYERHKVQTGELELPLTPGYPETPTVEHETNGHQTPTGSGRARRDAAARAMQGWHSHRLLGFGEEKNSNNSQKREKSLKSLGSLKHKRQSEVEHSAKALRTETSRQLVTTVADIGPPANWVKINVRETKDCFEVYALVPGLLREEVRVQSDPAGRLIITGQPEQLDNPWGISSFKKVISLPARIDPLRTSAIVSLHGRLLVKVPFEQSNI